MSRSKAPSHRPQAKRGAKGAPRKAHAGDPAARRWLVCAIVMLGVVLLGLAERVIWVGALVRELGVATGALALLLAVGALASRRALPAGVLIVASLTAWLPSWPMLRPVRLTPEKGPLLRVAEATLDGAPIDERAARGFAASTRMDLLAVVGATHISVRTLDAALPHMPHRARELGADRRQAIWSRLPLRGSKSSAFRVRVGKCDVQMVVMSVAPLARVMQKAERSRELRALEAISDSARAVWLGALGSRPQAPDFERARMKQRLRDTRLGHGPLATHPSWLGPFGLSTDHVLVRGWIAVRERAIHEPLGESAHATLTSTLELTDPRCH